MAIENRFATENLVQNSLDDLASCVAFIDTENNETITDVEISDGDITVDSTLSTSSVNPVQNKVVTNAINQLSEQKVDKQGITLDKDTDGLIYIFVDGVKVGNGVEVNGEIIEGDVTGILDENNNLLLSGALADGTYTLKWLLDDGTYSDAGTMVVGEVTPTYTNLFDTSTASINKRWSCTSGSTSAKDGFVASAKIDFGKNMSIPAVANATDALKLRIRPNGLFLALSDCNIQYFDSDGVRNGGWYLQGATNGITMGTDENGDTYIYLAHQGSSVISGVRYFAIGLKVSDSAITTDDIQDIIVTLNEPITD